jgi:hypothetical protein
MQEGADDHSGPGDWVVVATGGGGGGGGAAAAAAAGPSSATAAAAAAAALESSGTASQGQVPPQRHNSTADVVHAHTSGTLLFLGPLAAAQDTAHLASIGCAHVVTVMHEPPPPPAGIQRYHIDVRDSNDEGLAEHFGPSSSQIEGWLRSGHNVMVHCSSGVSRSAAVALAYIIVEARISLDQAYTDMRAARPCICPGTTFFRELQQLEVATMLAVASASHGDGDEQRRRGSTLSTADVSSPQPSMSIGAYYAHTVQQNAAMMGGQVQFEQCVVAVEKFGHATDHALLQAIEYAISGGDG